MCCLCIINVMSCCGCAVSPRTSPLYSHASAWSSPPHTHVSIFLFFSLFPFSFHSLRVARGATTTTNEMGYCAVSCQHGTCQKCKMTGQSCSDDSACCASFENSCHPTKKTCCLKKNAECGNSQFRHDQPPCKDTCCSGKYATGVGCPYSCHNVCL